MHVDDLKESLSLDGASQINIFFVTASWLENTFRGWSTFPWEKNVHTSAGNLVCI